MKTFVKQQWPILSVYLGILAALIVVVYVDFRFGAILMDVLFPTASTNITWQLLLGISITGAAVVLASGKKKTKTQ